jgi:hypothetical protein
MSSFALLVASALFTIPFERLKSKHPLAEQRGDLIKRMGRKPFLEADFWSGRQPNDWRFSRIMSGVNDSREWKDEQAIHPMNPYALNSIDKRKADLVLRVIRNALAHGNVVYLNENGFEEGGDPIKYLAFLSRYEETEEDREKLETYRVATTTEEGFVTFVKCWASWLSGLPKDLRLAAA